MRKVIALLTGLIAVGMTTSSTAAMMSAPNGWYLEANGGSSHLSNVDYPGSLSESGLGYNANLGYKFMPYMGLEMGYSGYPTANIKDASDTKAAQVTFYSYDAAIRAILPLMDSGFELFGKIGAQHISNRLNRSDAAAADSLGITSNSAHTATGMYYGVGGQYYIYPELAGVVQWQRAQGNNSTGTQDLFTAGISFLFV